MVTFEMLTTASAARRAGLSEGTIRQWLRDGVLPSTETPLGRLIDAADLEDFLEARERQRAQRVKVRQVGRKP